MQQQKKAIQITTPKAPLQTSEKKLSYLSSATFNVRFFKIKDKLFLFI